MSDSGAPSGADIIRDFVTRLPGKPGVYRMIDGKGDVIYVGKARNLRSRVSNYTRMGGHTNRIAAMIALTVTMEFVTTAREAEALLLEANLIKKLEPRYHVNLVETLCELIAAACLTDKRVMAARVRIEKPDIIKNARSVGVEIERVR